MKQGDFSKVGNKALFNNFPQTSDELKTEHKMLRPEQRKQAVTAKAEILSTSL